MDLRNHLAAQDVIVRKHRIFAVDDEQLAIRRLQIVLGRMPEVDLVGTANSVSSAIEQIKRLHPDVLLLDIAMPGATGFELVDSLPPGELPHVIFVTAFDEYAIEAFDRNAIDYLLKPLQPDRLRKALERAGRISDLEEQAEQLKRVIAKLAEEERASAYEDEFWAHRHSELVRVAAAGIRWAQAERDYVRLHTDRGSFLVRGTMDSIERRLNPREFTRVHRSALVRVEDVVSVRRRATGLLVATLKSGDEVKIGRRFAKSLSTIRSALKGSHPHE